MTFERWQRWPVMPIDREHFRNINEACKGKISYGFGDKMHDWTHFPPKDKTVDCSGWVRYVLINCWAFKGPLNFPDGSANQKVWIQHYGFKESNYESGFLRDDFIRIAFLPGTKDEAGHVLLILNGWTYESRGRKGVDNRLWGSQPFMKKMTVFVLDIPRGIQ